MKYERFSKEEKSAIIYEVGKSHLSIRESPMLLGISRSTYYNWLKRREGERRPRKPANHLTDMEVDRVVEHNFPFADASDGDGISTAQTQIRAI